jgi:peptide/nickel transport system ATP-binding protein
MSAEPIPTVTADATADTPSAVRVEDLEISTSKGTVVVAGISFEIAAGEVLGLVGESGSGKTTVGLALLGHARRGLKITGGTVMLGDRDILRMSDSELRRLRGDLVSYVPQDPASSLNPALRIGTQLSEVLEAHNFKGDQGERIAEMMREVALSDDPEYLKR